MTRSPLPMVRAIGYAVGGTGTAGLTGMTIAKNRAYDRRMAEVSQR